MAIFGLVPAYPVRITRGARTTRLFGRVDMALAAGNLAGGMLHEWAGPFLPVHGTHETVTCSRPPPDLPMREYGHKRPCVPQAFFLRRCDGLAQDVNSGFQT
jgi:hypothetical protein